MGVSYENGSIHSPVIVLGDDPSVPGNVLVSRLATAVSVPKGTITEEEGTPVDSAGNAITADSALPPPSAVATEDKDAEIASLKAQLTAATSDSTTSAPGDS